MSDKRTILIVEDNPMNLKLARDVLEAKGYRVVAAENGEDGVALAGTEQPDLVLMDIQLPGIDGVEALQRLRNDPATANIPIVAFTASVMAGDRSRVTAAGFDAFLSKPIDLKPFLATVTRLLDGGPA
ncbi:MAG: response regulator [Gammaproteobacteria bacterium]|nr:response regulator [Gammaproteobacteria bacterium]MCP5200469.1 response regulator [Gammaproteobacteria bacterium]